MLCDGVVMEDDCILAREALITLTLAFIFEIGSLARAWCALVAIERKGRKAAKKYCCHCLPPRSL